MCDMERGEEVTEDEREEREFLRLSAAMGAEFLRLVLDEPASAAGAMGLCGVLNWPGARRRFSS